MVGSKCWMRMQNADWFVCALLQVYKAEWNDYQQVAVKQLKQHDARNDIRFLREIAILKECRSTNVVQFLVRPMLFFLDCCRKAQPSTCGMPHRCHLLVDPCIGALCGHLGSVLFSEHVSGVVYLTSCAQKKGGAEK